MTINYFKFLYFKLLNFAVYSHCLKFTTVQTQRVFFKTKKRKMFNMKQSAIKIFHFGASHAIYGQNTVTSG